MTENSLVLFTKAAQMLAEADTIQKTKELKDLAIMAGDWAKRKGMGEDAIRYARSYAMEAERKMGGLLVETERQKPGEYQRLHDVTVAPTLAELGLSKRESAQAQLLASLPQETFEEVKSGKKSMTKVKRERKRDEVIRKVQEFPSDKYRVLYGDPPWRYSDSCDSGAIQSGGSDSHYDSMTISEICALPVGGIAEDNSVLFLWATSPMLPEALVVVNAWGFKYKASFVWDKVKHNMGHYNSVRHELLLVCTRGSCLPDISKLIDSVQTIERTEHSVKPEEFRNIIDTLYPYGRRIELFGRKQVENWEVWGNESPSSKS